MHKQMKIEPNPTGPALSAVASLHYETLPKSIISRLGLRYTQAFYRYAVASKKEIVFVARTADGSVLGGALLSLDPTSLTRRVVFGTPLAWHLLNHPRLLLEKVRDVLPAVFGRNSFPQRSMPELLAIFTRKGERGRGIGRELLRHAESALSQKGMRRYVVRTEARAENKAIMFYHREGFQDIGRLSFHNHIFQVLMKEIHRGEGSQSGEGGYGSGVFDNADVRFRNG